MLLANKVKPAKSYCSIRPRLARPLLPLWSLLLGCLVSVSPRTGLAQPSDSLSIHLNLKIHQAVDLRSWNQPFSFSLALLTDTTAAILKMESPQFKNITEIDSTFQTVKLRRVLLTKNWWQPVVFDMNDYIEFRLKQDLAKLFREQTDKSLLGKQAAGGAEALTIEIPFKIKSKTFNKIFGGDRVRLRISGNINIQGGFRREGRSQVATVTGQNTDYSFHIDQTQAFKITGQVGDKVSVEVDQNSERMFEFENALKLTYTGYEDEVIQKIEAGNISMQLAGTQLATFSGQNKGLFGLKSDLKIGALKLTTIASLEKGQKNKLTITGGAHQSTQVVDAIQPRQSGDRYFFLDNLFRDQYKYFSDNMLHTTDVLGREIDPNYFFLYKMYLPGTGAPPVGMINAIAVYDSSDLPDPNFYEKEIVDSLLANNLIPDRNQQEGSFVPMNASEYFLDTQSGYFRLNAPINDPSVVLAVAYRITGNNNFEQTFGTLQTSQSSDSTNILKLLRPQSPQPTDDTWPLIWRHVYSMGNVNVEKEGFSMKIVYQPSSGSEIEAINVGNQQVTLLTLMGLDSRNETGQLQPDGKVDDNPALINYTYGEVIFPDLHPFNPELYFVGNDTGEYASALPDTLQIPSIYDSLVVYPSNMKLKFEYKGVTSVYQLGFNVLEGSEEVLLGGQKLQKGSDYVIDYYSGTLTILNENALSPSANLEILYESGELFQLDKKTLLGVRAEYALWDQSFIGGTALYLNERPLQDRVKVGNEPLRNFLWDLNSRMVFKPQFLTAAVDKLPLIETEAPSQFTVEMEYAQVHPNPNSLDNVATGDPDGVAYVDDFESIKKTTPLGIMRRQWTQASYPDTLAGRGRGVFVWYNPYDQIPISQIWPNRPTNANVAQNTNVLTFQFYPTISDPEYPSGAATYAPAWGGVMRSLSAGYANQSKSKYIEIMLQVSKDGVPVSGLPGRLHIELGQIDEDVIDNDTLDTEDIKLDGLPFGNGFLDTGEDNGLDGIGGTNDYWIVDGDTLQRSHDKWYYNPNNHYDLWGIDQSTGERWSINGTEGNMNDEGGRYPDTEDLNKNGILDSRDNYFGYMVDLSETVVNPSLGGANPDSGTHFLITEPNDYDWKLYRIPLNAGSTIGNPNLTQIEYARVWLDGFEDSTRYDVSIATLEIVGNEWEAVPDTSGGASNERVSVEMINTYDNPSYGPPPGVAGYQDPVTKIVSQEQSLLLRINDLPDSTEALVVRRLYDTMDFLEYKKLKMFVHGGGISQTSQQKFSENNIWMFFRFGADTTRNYYEYRQRIWPDWEVAHNNIEIDLDQLAKLKLDRPPGTDRYAIATGDSDSLAVMGNPSLSQIRQFTVGLVTWTGDIVADSSMEVWFDEMRVSGVKKDVGRAARASADLTLADLATLHANVDIKDGNFHNVNTRVGTRSNSFTGAATGTVQLQKLLNPKWGFSIPVSGNLNRSESVPYYFANSDVLVDQNNPAQVDTVKTASLSYGAGIDVSKNTPSGSPWLKYSLDKLSGGYDYARTESSNPSTAFSKSTSNSANLGYNLTFGRPSLSFLTWLNGVPYLRKYSTAKLYYLLTKLNLTVTGTEAMSNNYLRMGPSTFTHTFFLTKGLSSGLRPFENLTIDYNRTHKADLLLNHENPKGLDDIMKGDLGWAEDVDVSQNVTASYTPRLFTWLDTDARYNTAYHWTWGQGYSVSGQTVSNNTTMSASGTLKLTQIFKKPGSETPAGQPPVPPPGQPPAGKEPESGGQPPQPPGQEPGSLLNPTIQPGDSTRLDSTLLHGAGGDSTRLDTTAVDTTTRELLEIARPTEKSAVGDFWYAVRYTITRLRDIRVEYTQQNNWSDPLVSGQAGLLYQLGFNSHDLSRIDSSQGISGFSARSRSDDYKVKSGLDFSKNFKISLNYNYRWSRSESNSVNGTLAESQLYFFRTRGDSIGVFQIPIPEWSITWSGWEKFPAFQKIAETVSLENTFTGTRTTTWQDRQDNVTKHDYTRNFNPLLGINMTFKKGVTSSIRYNWTETGTVTQIPSPAKSRNRQSNLQLSVGYTMKTGFKIPIPVWPFKNKRFKNNTTFALALNMSANHSDTEASGKFTETTFTKTWSVKPSLDYTFSNTVTGGMHFEYGVNKNKTAGDSNFQEFGIRVNITIRG